MKISILKGKLLLIPAASAIILCACQDVIKVDLNNAAPQTVIEGSLSSLSDTVEVFLSQTTDYFSPQNITPITDATVSISDNSGNTFQPLTSAKGVYFFGKLAGTPGKSYTLKVQTSSATYTAQSQMPNMVPIDSLTVTSSSDGDKENDLNCFIRDPAGIKNYYRIRVFRNGSVLRDSVLKTEPIILFIDKYFDGRSTFLRVPSRRVGIDYFNPGDTIKVQLMSIDSYMYYFLRELRDITRTGRFISSTSTPDNPDNNISNHGLGYFSAWAISEKTLVVDKILNSQ